MVVRMLPHAYLHVFHSVLHIMQVAHSLGLYAFGRHGPPLGPLLGMLLAAVALAALQRSRLKPQNDR